MTQTDPSIHLPDDSLQFEDFDFSSEQPSNKKITTQANSSELKKAI